MEARAAIAIAVVMHASLYPATVAVWMWMLFQGTARAADNEVAAATGLVKPTLCFLKLVPNSKRTKVGGKQGRWEGGGEASEFKQQLLVHTCVLHCCMTDFAPHV